jgi:hypothetical protein
MTKEVHCSQGRRQPQFRPSREKLGLVTQLKTDQIPQNLVAVKGTKSLITATKTITNIIILKTVLFTIPTYLYYFQLLSGFEGNLRTD